MINFKSITLKNFLSYGAAPTVIPLDGAGTTLILGEDLDNTASGSGANGVGKTSILNALAYAVYDKPISDISKDNLVNNINKKNMEVTVVFDKNGITYTIKRARKTKAGAAGNHVHLFEGDRDVTPDSVANTNKLIETVIGVPYEIFVRIVTFTATHTPFFSLPLRSAHAANQTDIIEDLFDLKSLSLKADRLKELIKDCEQSLKTKKIRLEDQEQERLRLEQQIENAQVRVSNWSSKNALDVKELEQKIEKVESVNVDEQHALNQKLGEVNTKLQQALVEQREVEKAIKSKDKVLKEKTNEIQHLQDDKCPYCLQKYIDVGSKIDECENIIGIEEEEVATLTGALSTIDDDVRTYTDLYKEIQDQITVSNVEELMDIKVKISAYRTKLEELRLAENPHLESLQELQDVEMPEVDMDEINEVTTTIKHQKFLLGLLTKKDSFVRKTLLDKNIPFLNSRLQHYLTELGLMHTVEFTHEMTANISQFGRKLDYGNLSNGQQARVNLALSFAFSDVRQFRTERINICLLDEVLDVGLDTVGVQKAARMLKRKAREEDLSLFVISHRDEIDSAFDNKMIIQMEKGFSYVKGDE